MSKEKVSQYDKMTKTPIPKLVFTLSIPTIISMMVTNIYNLVDTAFVGKLGNSASGAIGIVFGFMAILMAVGFTFGQGSGVQLSKKLGERNIDEASRLASSGLFWAFTIGAVIMVLSFLFMDPLVMFLGSTKTIAPYAKTYVSFIIATAPFTVSGFTLNNILRYEGKAFYGMIGLMTGAVLNIGGDALFMFVLNMGIAGAGLSTAISQVVSWCILLVPFIRHQTSVRLSLKKVYFALGPILGIVSVGFPSLLRQGLNSAATIILNLEASAYGDEAVAAMSIVSRVIFFTFALAVGTGQGFQPVSAFNNGAGKYSRVRKGFWYTCLQAELLVVIATSLVLFNCDSIIQIFRDDPTVIAIGTRALRLQCYAQYFLPICMVTEMLYQSSGKRLGASYLSSTRAGLYFVPVLLIMAKFRGLSGIQEAQAISNMIAFVTVIFFIIHYMKVLPKEDLPDKEEQ